MGKTLLLSKILLRQNLATMLGLDGSGRRKSTKASTLLVTGIIAVVLLLLTGALGYGVHALTGVYGSAIGRSLLTILLAVTGFIMLVLAIPSVLGSFYASSDIEDLLPLPLATSSIVTAKSIAAIASSYVFPTMVLLGPLAGWGIAGGEGALYWVMTVVIVIFAPLLPFAYAGIISMAVARFSRAARRKDVVTTISTVVSIAIVVLSMLSRQFFNGDSSAETLIQVGNTMSGLLAVFPSYGFAIDAIDTASLSSLLIFVIISIAGIAVFIAFAQLVYLRTVTSLSSSGGRSRAYTGEAGKSSGSAGRAILNADLKRAFRTPALWLNQALMPLIIMVIASISMTSSALPKLMETMNEAGAMNESGFTLIAVLSCSLTVLLAGLVGAANRLSGTIVSREGTNWDFMKTIPVNYEQLVKAKMLPGVFVNMALLAIPVCMMVVPLTMAGLSPIVIASTIVLGLALSWLSGCVAASSDAANPRVSWGNDAEVDNKTVGGGAGTLRGIVATIVYAAFPLIAFTGLPWTIVLPVAAVVGLVLAIVLGRVFLRKAARNLGYLER